MNDVFPLSDKVVFQTDRHTNAIPVTKLCYLPLSRPKEE